MLPSFLYFLPFLTCQSCHHFEHSFAGISRNNLQILAGLWCHPNIWVELLVVHGSHCTTMPTDCQAFPLSPPQIRNAALSPWMNHRGMRRRKFLLSSTRCWR